MCVGIPIYSPRNWDRMMNPSPFTPISSVTTDPWWYDDMPRLRPADASHLRSPSHLRDSFLSPIKNTYGYEKHPFRALGKILIE